MPIRLISTDTWQLHSFLVNVPQYAVLSHRWSSEPDGETTLQKFNDYLRISKSRFRESKPLDYNVTWEHFSQTQFMLTGVTPLERYRYQSCLDTDDGCQRSARWAESEKRAEDVSDQNLWKDFAFDSAPLSVRKVLAFCRVAKDYGYSWAWIDTACINKMDNAELSEAINSMFRWYRNSACCIVYLEDINPKAACESLHGSTWLKRGWTLQELVAPRYVKFCASDWTEFGTKASLNEILTKSTGIPASVLNDSGNIGWYCMAQRMSWAAQRIVSREEDIAYCLLGMFDISMPLLYGEGSQKAFERLQMSILEQYEDESLLAWHEEEEGDFQDTAFGNVRDLRADSDSTLHQVRCTGILARSPRSFRRCGQMELSKTYAPEDPFRMSPRGLEIIRDVYDISDLVLRSKALTSQALYTIKETEASHVYGANTESDCKLLMLPLACTLPGLHELFHIVVAEDHFSKPINKWCRISSSKLFAYSGSLLSARKSQAGKKHLYVHVGWPNAESIFAPNAKLGGRGAGGPPRQRPPPPLPPPRSGGGR